MRTCKEVMTRDPHCCQPTETVARVAQLMKTQDVGSVLICEDDQSKKLLGIVTDRDLTLKVVVGSRDANALKAQDVMTRQPFTCLPEDDAQKALDAMGNHQVRRIPVVDNNGRLVGIIAQADVATRMKEPEKVAGMLGKISKPGSMKAG
jgi:CBS domain-containing protein